MKSFSVSGRATTINILHSLSSSPLLTSFYLIFLNIFSSLPHLSVSSSFFPTPSFISSKLKRFRLKTLDKNLSFWFRASLIYINNCPTRCNTKQSIYYSASSLYMFRVSNTPIIRSKQNCNYSLRYCTATSLQPGQAWPRWREVAAQKI